MNAMTETRFLTTLEDRFITEEGRIYLNGMQALLRLMLDQRRADARAGLNTAGLVTGYPGSPMGGVDDVMLENKHIRDANHIVFQPALNEELAATALWGTQTLELIPGPKYDGVFGLWYGKSPGLDRAGDALHHANFRGVGRNGGVLIAVGDDPHARSTICPSDTNMVFHSFYMPVLAPSSIQEILDFGLHGYALSRASGLWVGFKVVTDVADSTAAVDVAPTRIKPIIPEVMYEGKRLEPSLVVNEMGGANLATEKRIHDGRLEIVRRYARLNGLNRIMADPAGARIGIMCGGKTYRDVRQALTNLGIDDAGLHRLGIRILKMGLLYPVEPTIVQEFAQGLDEIFVIEDKRPMLELYLKDLLYSWDDRPVVVGKKDEQGNELLTAVGQLNADQIAPALYGRLLAQGLSVPKPPRNEMATAKPIIPLAAMPARTPYFCSGCPHNRSMRVPEGSVVGAGIGCHIMISWIDAFGDVKGYTQMGGEGAQFIGVAPFTTNKHYFQNLGDGTFHHSGSLAVRAAIASGINMTYKILYNGTVGMTGGQDVMGGMTIPRVVQNLMAEGAKRIVITTDEPEKYPGRKVGEARVRHRDDLVEVEKELAATPGVTVLINDQHCAAEKRRLRKKGTMGDRPKAAFINTRVCEGCGDCGAKSNCLSVQPVPTEFGRKTQIHQSSCNQDFSCMDGDCPSFLTVQTLEGGRPKPAKKGAIEFPVDVRLPEPVGIADASNYNAVMIGIGGTGVVTVNQVLGMAAFMDGLQVQAYDDTGSSQKAGPVVSHLKLYPRGEAVAATLSKGSADLYLALDALGGVNPVNLAMASAERTVAVVSTSSVPTGEMVAKVASRYPAQDELTRRIAAVTRSDRNAIFDGQKLAENLLGDHMASNLLMVGVAYQLGVVPISATAIEAAIRLNGTAVKMNLDAFRWGRLQVADPQRVRLAIEGQALQRVEVPTSKRGLQLVSECLPDMEAGGELGRLLALRADDLMDYQDENYVRTYLSFVRQVRTRRPKDDALAVAVARNLYKLMAYKDEYEVARLHLSAETNAALTKAFGSQIRVKWNFHPTFLRALGVRKKVQVGGWFRPVLRLLKAMKRIRGTPFDLLGQTEVRRVERALARFYMASMEAALAVPQSESADLLALAEAPDVVRGYEHVKLRNVAAFLAQVARLQAGLCAHVEPEPVLARVRETWSGRSLETLQLAAAEGTLASVPQTSQ